MMHVEMQELETRPSSPQEQPLETSEWWEATKAHLVECFPQKVVDLAKQGNLLQWVRCYVNLCGQEMGALLSKGVTWEEAKERLANLAFPSEDYPAESREPKEGLRGQAESLMRKMESEVKGMTYWTAVETTGSAQPTSSSQPGTSDESRPTSQQSGS